MKNLSLADNKVLTMSSLEIAKFTSKRHDHVMRDIKKMLFDLYPAGAPNFGGTYLSEQNKELPLFNLDRKHTDCLLTGYSATARMKVIERWHELESKELQVIPNFTDPAQAARAWAEQYEANAVKQKQLELAAPKVEFHDKIVNDENTLSFRDAAKKIQQRPNKFIEWLRESGYICLNNLARQQYITQGLFVTHSAVSGSDYHFTQCRVTGKGLAYFAGKLVEKKL